MPSRFRAVLFDFDGTLADSYEAITASVNYVRASHSLPPLTEREVRARVGHGLLQLMAEIVPGGDPARDAQLYLRHHPSVMYQMTRLLPGVAESLAALRTAGLRLAVCSNKPVIVTRELLKALGIADKFDAALGPEDAGKPKPDPAMLLMALKMLGVGPHEALYVGDMPVDIEAARNAGVAVWVAPTGSSDEQELRLAKPDQLLNSLAELAPAILGASRAEG